MCFYYTNKVASALSTEVDQLYRDLKDNLFSTDSIKACEFLLKGKKLNSVQINILLHDSIKCGAGDMLHTIFNNIYMDKERAKYVLVLLAENACEILSNELVKLIQIAKVGRNELLRLALNAPEEKNTLLISTIIKTADESSQAKLFKEVVDALCEQKDFINAQWLIDEIGIVKRKTGSLLATYAEKIKYLLSYADWSIRSYKEERFPELSRRKVTQYMQPGSYNKFIDLLETETLQMAAVAREQGARQASAQKFTHIAMKKGIDLRFVSNPKAFTFIDEAEINEAMRYYDHPTTCNELGEPLIRVNGVLTPMPEVLERFEVKKLNVGPKNIPIIVEKTSGKQWCYLERGLVARNQKTEFNAINHVPPSGKYTISFFCSNHGNTSTPGGIKRLMSSHAWVEMEDAEGAVYNTGKCGGGFLLSPDMFAFSKYPKIKVSFELLKDNFFRIKHEIQKAMRQGTDFNLLNQNCATFSGKIASFLFPEITATTRVGEHNTLENRIKFFVVSRDLSRLLIKSHADLQQYLAELPEEVLSLDTLDTVNTLNTLRRLLTTFRSPNRNTQVAMQLLQQTVDILSEPSSEELSDRFEQITLAILNVLKSPPHSETELCNKIFNLFSDIVASLQDAELDHPYALFLHLKEQKKAKVAYTR